MRTGGQCYSESSPGVPCGEGAEDGKGSLPQKIIVLRADVQEGSPKTGFVPEILTELLSPSRHTLNPPPHCSLPRNAFP